MILLPDCSMACDFGFDLGELVAVGCLITLLVVVWLFCSASFSFIVLF